MSKLGSGARGLELHFQAFRKIKNIGGVSNLGSQVWGVESGVGHKYTQIYKYANMPLYIPIYKYANSQYTKYTNGQLDKYTHIQEYECTLSM